jgi:hypothetical protein
MDLISIGTSFTIKRCDFICMESGVLGYRVYHKELVNGWLSTYEKVTCTTIYGVSRAEVEQFLKQTQCAK